MNKRHSYLRVSPLQAQRKSIFYLTLELLRGCKLLLLYSTCSWRSPILRDRFICVRGRALAFCVCACVSTQSLSDLYPALLSRRSMRGMLRACESHTVTILQTHPSMDPSAPHSTHPCSKAHYRADCFQCATFHKLLNAPVKRGYCNYIYRNVSIEI